MNDSGRNRIGLSSALNGLSTRQRQCMILVAKGLTSKQIARELSISPSTVDNHVRAVVDRLGAENRMDAAKMALANEVARSNEAQVIVGAPQIVDDNQNLPNTTFNFARLPSLGGAHNKSPFLVKFLQVVQVSLFGVMAFAVITATIAGLIQLFER